MIEVGVATAETVAALDALYPEPERPSSRHGGRFELQQLGRARYLIATDGEPIGWALLIWPGAGGASDYATEAGLAELEDLSVVESARRRGAGRALLLAAEDAAHEHGCAGITLVVTVANPYNAAARELYAAAGFVDAGLEPFEDGYWYWTPDGERHWDGEPHLRLVKRF